MPGLFALIDREGTTPKDIDEFLENYKSENKNIQMEDWIGKGSTENTITALHLAISKKKFNLIPSILNFASHYEYAIRGIEDYERREARLMPENALHHAIKILTEEEALRVLEPIIRTYPHATPLLNADIVIQEASITTGSTEKKDEQDTKKREQQPTHILGLAFQKNYLRIAEVLLSHPELNINRQNPFYWAMHFNCNRGVELLLNVPGNRVNINRIEQDGLTPLIRAVSNNNLPLVNCLLQAKNIEVNATNDPWRQTALHIALQNQEPNLHLIELLLQRGATLDSPRDRLGRTARDLASMGPARVVIEKFERERVASSKANERQGFIPAQRIHQTHVSMTPGLFAHINNDDRIKGRNLEGNVFSNTAQYAKECLDFFQASSILGTLNPSEKSALEVLSKKFNAFGLIDANLSRVTNAGLNAIINVKRTRKLAHPSANVAEEEALLKKREQTEKQIEKIKEDHLNELTNLILKQLSTEKNREKRPGIFIPGGWRAEPEGHAMAYEIAYDSAGNILFTVFNAGDGLQFHNKKTHINKEKFSPILQFQIPPTHAKHLPFILKNLMACQTNPLWDETSFDAKKMYEALFKTMAIPGITLLSVSDTIPYISGQRAGTCSWKSLMSILKVSLPKQLYKKIKLQIKFQSIVDFFISATENNTLGAPLIAEELFHAIGNINRIILKQTRKGINVETFREIITTLEHIEKILQQNTPHTFPLVRMPSSTTMATYQETEKYTVERTLSKYHQSFLNRPTSRVDCHYLTQSPLYFPANPMADLKKLLEDIQVLKSNPPKTRAVLTIKRIEYFISKVPLNEPYWASLSPENLEKYLYELGYLQRSYGEALNETGIVTAFESRILTPYKMLAIQTRIAGRYFNDPVYGTFIHNISKIQKDIQDNIFTKPEFIITNSHWAKIAAETEAFFEKSLQSSGQENQNPISWQNIGAKNNFDVKTMQETLEKSIGTYRENHLKGTEKPRLSEIENKTEYALWLGMQPSKEKHAKERIEPPLARDLNFFAACEILLTENQALRTGAFSFFNRMGEKLSNTWFFSREFYVHLKPAPDAARTGIYQAILLQSRNPNNYTEHSIDNIHPSSFKMKFPFLEASLFSEKKKDIYSAAELEIKKQNDREGMKKTTENSIQTTNASELDADTENNRLIQHTRVNPETSVFATIEYALSNMHRFSDVDYQALLTINLFNPSVLKNALDRNPSVAGHLLKLIEGGLNYYTEANHIQFPVTYFFKLNNYLIDHLNSLPREHPAKIFSKEARRIQYRMRDFLSQNNPQARSFENENEREHAIILQRNLYLNILQKIAIELRHCQELLERREELTKILSNYLTAQFYIQKYDFQSTDPNLGTDPLYTDIQNSLIYQISPLMDQLFHLLREENEGEEKIFIEHALEEVMPDIRKQAITKIDYDFPILTCHFKESESITIDLSEGRVSKQGMAEQSLPNWVYENEQFQKLFGSKRRDRQVSLDNTFVIVSDHNHQYRINHYGFVFKFIEINGVKQWFLLCDNKNEIFNGIPHFLRDKGHQIWKSVDGIEGENALVIGALPVSMRD